MTNGQHISTPLAALVAALALSACAKHDERTVGQQVVSVVATAQRQAADAKQAAESAGTKAADGVSDATITTTVTAELARDARLDPTNIDISTAQGRVALRGTAPDLEARQRATRIVMAISGVKGVDNYLTVAKS